MPQLTFHKSVYVCMGLVLMVHDTPGEYMVAAHSIALRIAREWEMEELFLAAADNYREEYKDAIKGVGLWQELTENEVFESFHRRRPKSRRSSTRSGMNT